MLNLRRIAFVTFIILLLVIKSTTTSAASTLKLQYKTPDTNASDNQFVPQFNLVNLGSSPVALSTLKLRYYFTRDTSDALVFNCDWATIGCGTITGTFGAVSPAQTNADTYLEVGFTTAAGSIAANGSSGEIQTRINSVNWLNFNESNDYSRDATKTSYADWTKVTIYENGILIWGTPPGGTTSPTSTSVPPTTAPTKTNTPTSATSIPTTAPTKTNTPSAPTNTSVPPTNPPPTGALITQIRTNGAETSQQTPFAYAVKNTGSSAVSGVSVRVYFTLDGTNAASNYVIEKYYDSSGIAAISAPTLVSGSVYYFTVSYGSASLAAGAEWDFQTSMHLANWGTTFDGTNDWYHTGYAFNALPAAFTNTNYVPAYINGTLAWGQVPGSSPVPTNTSVAATATRTNTPVVTSVAPTNTPSVATNTSVPPTKTNTPNGPTATPVPGGQKRVIGYFEQWGIYQLGYFVKNIDTSGAASKLTHINYAFGNISADTLSCYEETRAGWGDAWADYQRAHSAAESVDGVADTYDTKVKGNFGQLKKLKAKYPNLKVVISLGGWTWSGRFSDAALTATSRAHLVSSCIDLYIKGNLPLIGGDPSGGPGSAVGLFDGIDIDWEYPASAAFGGDPTRGIPPNVYRPEDTQNYTLLLAEFRRQLDAQGAIDGKHYILSIAAPAGEDKYTKIELGSIHQYLDYLNLMTYDFHGSWDTTGPTNFHSPLYGSPNDPSVGVSKNYYADYAVSAYLTAGVPANKLVLGVPFYGRGWTNVPNVNNGLYQSSPNMQPAPAGTEPGFNNYNVLIALGYPSFRDPITKAFWIFNGTTFWSFDDATSMGTKISYIKTRGLGGAMIWPLDGDSSNGRLMTAISTGLQ